MYAPENTSFAKKGVSGDDDIATLSEKLPRLYSINDKYNRFRVEKLFNVYCAIVSDHVNNGESLLKVATSNTYRNERNEDCAILYMSVGSDRYSMYINEYYPDDESTTNSPNVLLFGIISDTYEQGMDAVSFIRQVMKPNLKPRQPLILFAYKTSAAKGSETDPRLLKELFSLSDEVAAYRCLDCSAVNRPTIRTVLAMALLAARPYISQFRSLSELKFDDDVTPVAATLSMPALAANYPARPTHKRKFLSRLLPGKGAISKMCNVQ